MLISLTLLLALAVLGLTVLGRFVHPLLALFAMAIAYGFASGMSFDYIAQSIGDGFGQVVQGVGLVILAGALLAVVARETGAARRLRPGILTLVGAVAGIGASASAGFALLVPLSGARGAARPSALALALNAGHCLLWPSPVLIAATAILGARVEWVLLFGALLVLPVAALGWRLAIGLAADPAESTAPSSLPPVRPWLQYLPIVLALPLLVVASTGHFPHEPFGGGGTRGALLGAGRAAVLLAVVVVVVLVLARRTDRAAIGPDGWFAAAIQQAAPVILLAGLAGGFARIAQNHGLPELSAERLLGLPFGILVPFLVAATVRTLGGSALVAAITAAGMVAPLLPALGLDAPAARGLAVAAIGAGSLAVLHVNDPLFWQASAAGGLTPGRGLRVLGLGSLVQGLAAAVLLLVLALFVA
jgi:GntP family gluconate:H+ symporter